MARRLRVLLITQGVSRLVAPVFSAPHDVVGVLESMPRDYCPNATQSWMYATLRSVYQLFKRREESLMEWCSRHKTPYHLIWKGNAAQARDWIEKLSPELIVVFSMSQLLKKDILELPALGVINLHPSYLPAYRGPNPDFWQYYDLVLFPGVTVHYIDPGEDTGDIIFQEKVAIALGLKSPAWLDQVIGGMGVPLVLKALDAIAAGAAPRVPQPVESPTKRARNLTPDEHASMIDWANWPIERVWHVLRGTESWLNAIPQPDGLFRGHRWSIDEFERTNEAAHLVPGTLTRHNGRSCVVARDGVIYLSRAFSWKRMVLGLLRQ